MRRHTPPALLPLPLLVAAVLLSAQGCCQEDVVSTRDWTREVGCLSAGEVAFGPVTSPPQRARRITDQGDVEGVRVLAFEDMDVRLAPDEPDLIRMRVATGTLPLLLGDPRRGARFNLILSGQCTVGPGDGDVYVDVLIDNGSGYHYAYARRLAAGSPALNVDWVSRIVCEAPARERWALPLNIVVTARRSAGERGVMLSVDRAVIAAR